MHGIRSIDVTVGDLTTTGSSNIINTGVFLGQEDHAIKLEKCRNALFLSDPEIDRARLISEKGKRVDGTCEWIRKDEAYKTWRSGETNLLWINGGPGKGKTILSIFLTQELEREVETIYYFCSNNDQERSNAAAVLRGLIWQVTGKRPQLADGLLEHLSDGKRTQVTLTSPETLWSIFVKMLKDPRMGTIYCVLDGLDECDEYSQRWLVANLVELVSVNGSGSGNTVCKIAIISRPDVAGLGRSTTVRLDPDNDKQVGKDIQTFVSSRVKELASRVSLPTELYQEVQTTLLERSEGTFLWVGFAMVELLKKKTATQIQKALYSLPKGLPGIYGRMVLQIEEEERHTSLLILRWVALAFRPMSLAELAAAVGTQTPPHLTPIQAIRDQISMCGPLVKVEGKTASLVHQSARDYLLRDKRDDDDDDDVLEWFRIKPSENHIDLAVACVDCLVQSSNQARKFQKMEPDNKLRDALLAEVQEQFPLRDYAVEHWPDHAKVSSIAGTRLLGNEEFFDEQLLGDGAFLCEEPCVRECWWQEYRNSHQQRGPPERCAALHVASYFGILEWAQKLIEKRRKQLSNIAQMGGYVNQADGLGRTSLWWAACGGHEAIVRLLISTSNVDMDATDFNRVRPLQIAAEGGYDTVVQLLLATGRVDVNAPDSFRDTPLLVAAKGGHEAVGKLLLGYEAVSQLPLAMRKLDVDAKDISKQTPLSWAARNGHKAMVQLLLATDKVDVDAQDIFKRTPLWWAARNGHKAVVQLLLATSNVYVDAADVYRRTSLFEAINGGHVLVVQLLLATGKVDVDRLNVDGRTPISLAAAIGHTEVAQLLQEHHRRHHELKG